MADLLAFFDNDLPEKLKGNPKLASEIKAVYVFDITGVGKWTVDLTEGAGAVSTGGHEKPGCTVTIAKGDFETLLDKPASAMMLFTMGKLKVTNVPLALSLQKLLS